MTVRADNLGSLLRPPYLLDARHDGLTPDQLREVEDRPLRAHGRFALARRPPAIGTRR